MSVQVVAEAEKVVRRSRRRPGLIAAGVFALMTATGGLWIGSTPTDHVVAGDCGPVFAGRAGSVNTCAIPANTPTDDAIEKFIGTTAVGGILGGLGGGMVGLGWGLIGGAASNIPW